MAAARLTQWSQPGDQHDQDFDNIRLPSGNHDSKDCLIELALRAGHSHGRADWRTRFKVEDYLINNVLNLNLQQARTDLQRWANAP